MNKFEKLLKAAIAAEKQLRQNDEYLEVQHDEVCEGDGTCVLCNLQEAIKDIENDY